MASEFSPDLFVGRRRTLEELVRWAMAKKVQRRLRSIAAPPGYGKTWLLEKLKEQLSRKRDIFVIFIHCSRGPRSRADIATWVLGVLEEAHTVCPEIQNNDPGTSSEATIQYLLDHLCQVCSPPRRPILIVDGLDELSPSERRELEKHLLDKFWLHSCVRIIISFRDEFSLNSYNLRRSEERLPLNTFSEADGGEQLSRLCGPDSLDPPLEDLLELISPYTLSVPGLNTLLFTKIKENKQTNRAHILSADDLQACWLALLGDHPDDVEVIKQDLKDIVSRLDDNWTLEMFAEECRYTLRDALYHIQNLMKLSVVTQAQDQQYKVVDGLRELLRAEKYLRER